ncbi:MAG TPA: hypothetical protein VIO33_09645, partial [Burkholderiaceae bacterium]
MLSFIAIVIGGILGLGWGDSGYAGAIGALAGWLLVRSWQQQRRIGALEQALAKLPAAAATQAMPEPELRRDATSATE